MEKIKGHLSKMLEGKVTETLRFDKREENKIKDN